MAEVPTEDVMLTERDAKNVFEELMEAMNRAYELGLVFELPPHELDAIRKTNPDPRELLLQVILTFLRQAEPRPTWRVIVDALRSPAVNLTALAERVEAAHFPGPTATRPPPPATASVQTGTTEPAQQFDLSRKVVAEFDSPDDLEQFRQEYASHYGLHDVVMVLSEVRSGCFIVTWFVPKSVVKKLKGKVPRAILKKYSVNKLEIAGTCVYRLRKPQEAVPLTSTGPVSAATATVPEATPAATRIQGGGGTCPLCNDPRWNPAVNLAALARRVEAETTVSTDDDNKVKPKPTLLSDPSDEFEDGVTQFGKRKKMSRDYQRRRSVPVVDVADDALTDYPAYDTDEHSMYKAPDHAEITGQLISSANDFEVLQGQFNSLWMLVKDDIVAHQISTAQFSVLVASLPADTSNRYPDFLNPLKTIFSGVEDHDSLLPMVYYWHYLSFDMLDRVANSFNLVAVQREFNSYKNTVHLFRRRTTLIAFLENETTNRPCPSQFMKITKRFTWPETATLQLLEEFRLDYMALYELQPYSMILGFVEMTSHSFKVTWFIPDVMRHLLTMAHPEALINKYNMVGGEDRGETNLLSITDIVRKSFFRCSVFKKVKPGEQLLRLIKSEPGSRDGSKGKISSEKVEEQKTRKIPIVPIFYHTTKEFRNEDEFVPKSFAPQEDLEEATVSTTDDTGLVVPGVLEAVLGLDEKEDDSVLMEPGVIEAVLELDKKDDDEDGFPDGEILEIDDEEVIDGISQSGSAGVPEDKMQPEQNYNFVEELSDEYYCPILPGELLLEPYQTRCCGKHLSERTVGELYRRSRVCPLCKKRLDVTKDIHFGRRVRELPVFCSNKDRGCRWVAELSALEDHLDECLYHLDSATAEQGTDDALSAENEAVIVNELMNVRQVSLELGQVLKLPQEMLDSIKGNTAKVQLMRVIAGFLETEDPTPTWGCLIEALHLVKRSKLANKLGRKYCTPTAAKDEEIYPRLASNTVVMSTGTTFGHGFYGDVIEVAHKGIVIYAAKKYRHIDRKTLIKSFGSEQSLSVIRHPNLVSYCGVGALFGDQSPVVVMERMETNLGTFLEENLLGLNRKFGIIHDVVRGLNHLHSLTPPIIHGGLSEKNVLIDEKKVAKIADFGNSSVATSELTSAAQRAVLEFMPPELLEQGVCNEKVDVFSTGHLTIYVMNQHKPHPVLNSTFREKGVLKARSEVERRARYLDTMQGKLDGGSEHPLFQMVTHCLEDDADARPSCADILRSGLFTNLLSRAEFGPETIVEATGIVLGNGAYGNVMEVEYMGMKYAAKIFHPETQFNREHEILAQIRHRNIVPYHGMCKLAPDNTPVLVIERMEMNLGTYLTSEQNANLPQQRKLEILADVIQGLHHMHTHTPTIVHRDLTAGNVLLDVHSTAKIGDFGCSQILNIDVAVAGRYLRAIPGTMNYMPPEAQEGGGEFDEKFDIFSLGHLGIYVMIQRAPHPLLAHTFIDDGERYARTEVQRRQVYLDEVKDNLDRGEKHPLYSVLVRCLNEDPEERPSCAEILGGSPFSDADTSKVPCEH